MARIFFNRGDLDALGSVGDIDSVEYRVPVDVLETATAFEVIADLPGVAPESVRVSMSGCTIVIAGRKRAPTCAHREAAFHLAERTFGAFACAVRCEVAVDAGRARATLRAGELHVVLPRLDERRGREIPITIDPEPGATPPE
jgi:HSP20 family protein